MFLQHHLRACVYRMPLFWLLNKQQGMGKKLQKACSGMHLCLYEEILPKLNNVMFFQSYSKKRPKGCVSHKFSKRLVLERNVRSC